MPSKAAAADALWVASRCRPVEAGTGYMHVLCSKGVYPHTYVRPDRIYPNPSLMPHSLALTILQRVLLLGCSWESAGRRVDGLVFPDGGTG